MTEISIILPAYKEEETLEQCVDEIRSAIGNRRYEVIIVEDGCEKPTEDEAEKIASKNKNVKYIHSKTCLGKAKTIGKGIEHSKGNLIGFIDSDLSIPWKELSRLLDNFEESDDVLIGSRYLDGSNSSRNNYKVISSKLYNKFVSKMLATDVKDHQCGLKLFRRDVWNSISSSMQKDAWFWDISLIYEAKKAGFNVRELGIKWEASNDTGASLIRNGPLMLEKIVEVKLDEKNIPLDVRYGRFAIIGGLAALLNTAILYLLTDYFDFYYLLSSAIAIETNIVLMFFANNKFTFNEEKKGFEAVKGLAKSNMVRSVGVLTNLGLLYAFTEFLNMYYLLSNILALFVASIVNFIGEKRFTWEE